MLVNLDVLIGLSVVMLALSLVVTLAGQTASTALNVRGTNLRWGLSVLIQELHTERFAPPRRRFPLFGRDVNQRAEALVTTVLTHPLVSDSKVPLGNWKLATAIRFDELLKTVSLLGSAGAGGDGDLVWLSQNTRITEPWFNSIMDRVSQRFAMHMRIYTVVISLVLVAVIRVDTLHVFKTLRSDVALRSGLVSAAQQVGATDPNNSTDGTKVRQFANSVIAQLPPDQSILALLRPASPSPAGLLLSMMLLSLGAPFWFNTIKNLTGLRPAVAVKEEKERAAQGATPPDVGDRIVWKDL